MYSIYVCPIETLQVTMYSRNFCSDAGKSDGKTEELEQPMHCQKNKIQFIECSNNVHSMMYESFSLSPLVPGRGLKYVFLF